MLLAVAGVGIIYGSIGIVAEAVLAEAASGRREARRMAAAVAALRNHYILCRYGRVGSTVATELVHAGATVVVIDIEPASSGPSTMAISSFRAMRRPTRRSCSPGSTEPRAS